MGMGKMNAPPVRSSAAVAWQGGVAVRGERKPRPLPRGLGERPGEKESPRRLASRGKLDARMDCEIPQNSTPRHPGKEKAEPI